MSMEMLVKTAECLRKRGFGAVCCATAAEAADYVMKEAASAATIGQGGSVTLKQLGLPEKLAAVGKTPERKTAVDLFLLSANALTADGRIVNIDGNGNRVAAMCYGPRTVYVVVGRNKLVEGGMQQAVRRIKQVACPQNARRQGLSTPCASGACDVSACVSPMCRMTVSFERAPGGKRTVVLLIDEDLGY